MSFESAPVTQASLDAFIAAAQEKIRAYQAANFPTLPVPVITGPVLSDVARGTKYARIVRRDATDSVGVGSGSVYAFIELATGYILKPAGWSGPAKHARGSIHSPEHGAEYVGPYGPAYLR